MLPRENSSDFSSNKSSKMKWTPLPWLFLYQPYNTISRRNHLCHRAKGDFITVKGRHNKYISLTNQTAVQLFPFPGIFADLALHDFELSKIMVRSINCGCWFSILYAYLMTVYLLVICFAVDPSKIHNSYSEMVNLQPCFCSGFFQGEPLI